MRPVRCDRSTAPAPAARLRGRPLCWQALVVDYDPSQSWNLSTAGRDLIH